jgi:hypothetical protein
MQNFDTLFDAAIAEWPAALLLPVRQTGADYFIVDGLTEFDRRIGTRWFGDPSEVLMATLHGAISGAIHTAFRSQSTVVPARIDRDAVRTKFESDLRYAQSETVTTLTVATTWTAADRALIERYWSEPITAPIPHDAEQAFLDQIDCRFPYRDPDRCRELIVRGIDLSANAAFGVLHEISRPARRQRVTQPTLLSLLEFWRARCHHPAAPMMADIAAARIARRELSEDEAVAAMNALAKYQGLYAALAIVYGACSEPDRIDPLDDAIRQLWTARARGR